MCALNKLKGMKFNMVNKILKIINTFILVLLILFLNVGTLFISIQKIDYLILSKYLSYFGIMCLVFYLINKIVCKENVKLKDLIVICLGIFAYLSYSFAFDISLAFEGEYGRNEGIRVILTYYSVFLLASTLPKKNQRIIMYFFLFTGVLQIFIGTIQTLKITNILGYDRSHNWSVHFKFASGTLGNPNFYSTYILMCLLYVYGFILKHKSNLKIIPFLFLFIIFIYGLIIGNTTSCILAFMIVATFSLIIRIKKINMKKIAFGSIIVILVVLISLFILDNHANHRISYTMNKNFKEVVNVFKYGIKDETGNYRVYVWKETLKKVPKYIYTGIGIDNFSKLNDGEYICAGTGVKSQCFDKAHNEYLQKLITEGFASFMTYLILLCYTVYRYYKNKKQNGHDYGLYLAFISYLIQAFFNISVIPVAPIFFMIMGFINECVVGELNEK